MSLPLILRSDPDILAIHKPAGVNTHRADPGAQDGIYEFLRSYSPEYSTLAIQHRLDRETSGVLLFTRTPEANRQVGQQFEAHQIEKVYHFLTMGDPPDRPLTVSVPIAKVGNRYKAVTGGLPARTSFRALGRQHGLTLMEARPITGRTHQIRIHAEISRFPVLGDREHGPTGPAHDRWPRLYLHARTIRFLHPRSNEPVLLEAPYPEAFSRTWDGGRESVALALTHARDRRAAIIDPAETDAYRLVHGAGDALPGLYVDRLGSVLLVASASSIPESLIDELSKLSSVTAVYTKNLRRDVRKQAADDAAPVLMTGDPAPPRFTVRESGLRYELSLVEGYSVGIFLDQRQTRHAILQRRWGSPSRERGPRTVLNTFAYTGAFSVCAAKAGDKVTTVDLSRKYLDWGRDNFRANDLDPAAHDWIYGDVFDWLRRFAKQNRRHDLVILDPPTFSSAKSSGVFRAAKDYGRLARLALPLLAPGGTLLASTNAATLDPVEFGKTLRTAFLEAGRELAFVEAATQPLDFPAVAAEPAYLKLWWGRLNS